MTLDEERELLLRYRPWLCSVAKQECFRYFGHSRDEDEISQEGWVAIWQALRQDNGGAPLDWWLKMRARSHIAHVLKSRIAACRDARRTDITDATPGEQADRYSVWVQLSADDDLAEIEGAYHHGEIMAAINSLPRAQRSYIERRFWHGWTTGALDIYFGNSYKVWKPARDTLADMLTHLREEEVVG